MKTKNLQSKTKEGIKFEKSVKSGLDGFSLMFASAIKFDDLAKDIKNDKLKF